MGLTRNRKSNLPALLQGFLHPQMYIIHFSFAAQSTKITKKKKTLLELDFQISQFQNSVRNLPAGILSPISCPSLPSPNFANLNFCRTTVFCGAIFPFYKSTEECFRKWILTETPVTDFFFRNFCRKGFCYRFLSWNFLNLSRAAVEQLWEKLLKLSGKCVSKASARSSNLENLFPS